MSNSLNTFLHISDFHFSKRRARDQEIVVDALLNDLRTLCIGHRKPDLVLFSGDLVQAAGVDLHDDAYDFLLDKVAKVTGCSDERIFVLPGNHEVERDGLMRFAESHREWRNLVNTPNETEEFNRIYAENHMNLALDAKFSNYDYLDRYLRGGAPVGERKFGNNVVTVDHIAALNLDLVRFNTALLSTGGHADFASDERNLVVPEYAVRDAVKALTPGAYRIAMTHHPMSSLSEQSARYLEGEIAKHFNIHLFGHMHDPQPKSVVGLTGGIVANQSGAIFTSRSNSYNGYALITVDRSNGHSETLLRSYFKDRSEFADGIDIIDEGRWYPSQEARQHFRKIATPVDVAKFRSHLSGPALQALLERECAIEQENGLHDRFVAPPLKRSFFQDGPDESKVEIETAVSFDELGKSGLHCIIHARPEYGRTTLLKQLRYRLLADAESIAFPRRPVLFDFHDITSNPDNMLRRMRGNCELLPDGHDLESLLKLGHVSVLIDDVNFLDPQRMKILREFVTRYPKAQYLLSSPHASVRRYGASVDPEMPVRFDFVEVMEFRRNDMRQLLAKDARCMDVEDWLDRLQNEFREINLPFTAANGSILIEILSEKHNFSPVNRAVLMEQFVDSTLRKAAVEQSRRETFDYTNKTDLLSHIASWMARSDEYIPTREVLRTEMKSYIDGKGLIVPLDALLNEFLAARIFVVRSEDRISFRYRGVLEYFIAVRMTVDPDFKSWIMDADRYLRYVNEILYYAGKIRNDAPLIEEVSRRHAKIMDDAIGVLGPIDFDQLSSLQVPRDNHDVDESLEIARPPLTKEEKDEELEAEFPKDEESRQEVYRPKVEDMSTSSFLSLLLYSGLIKNMELIADADKRRHLSMIWHSWGVILVSSLRFAPKLAKERRFRVNGVLYEVQAPHGMADSTLLRQMILRLPHAHLRLISNTMGTEKLERQLTEPTLAEAGEPLIFEFFRTGLLADLRLSTTPGAVSALATKLKDHRYLLWSLIVHLGELRRLDRIKDSHFGELEATVAAAIADLKGGDRKQKGEERQRQMARLRRDRLVLSMREDRVAKRKKSS